MIKTTPQSERPRERCLSQGSECLSLRECLALILGSGPRGKGCMGVAADILRRMGGYQTEQAQEDAFFASMELTPNAYLQDLSGLGEAGRARLMAAIELARRYVMYRERASGKESPKIIEHDSLARKALAQISDAYRISAQEWLGFVPLSRSGKVGQFCLVEQGTRTHVNTDAVELFARILALRPLGIFLFHNHPSGDLRPSEADCDLTEQVGQICTQLGIRFLGHAIVSGADHMWIEQDVSSHPIDARAPVGEC